MKQSNILLAAAAAAGLYLVAKRGGAIGKALGIAAPTPKAGTTEVFDSNGLPYKNGWRYYSDGTSIDPQGNYYFNGTLVWSPAAA